MTETAEKKKDWTGSGRAVFVCNGASGIKIH